MPAPSLRKKKATRKLSSSVVMIPATVGTTCTRPPSETSTTLDTSELTSVATDVAVEESTPVSVAASTSVVRPAAMNAEISSHWSTTARTVSQATPTMAKVRSRTDSTAERARGIPNPSRRRATGRSPHANSRPSTAGRITELSPTTPDTSSAPATTTMTARQAMPANRSNQSGGRQPVKDGTLLNPSVSHHTSPATCPVTQSGSV